MILSRRDIMQAGMAAAGAAALGGPVLAQTNTGTTKAAAPEGRRFWPNGEQLVISISMQFEATAEPADAESPFPKLDAQYPDTIAPTWYRYGMEEGVPRLLDLFDRHGVKVTSHMVGLAVERNADLAREVVRRGHEASGHGQTWAPQYSMSPQEERDSYSKSADVIERITGQRPIGFNAFWMRHSRSTLEILQELGFIYHIDDIARDEPSITPVRDKPFAVVPYTFRNNDIVRFSNPAMTSEGYASDLKAEFDVLYAEGAKRRRMMSLSLHDRIGGMPAVVHAVEEFIRYAKERPGVVFMRKDEIARWALSQDDTPRNPPRIFEK